MNPSEALEIAIWRGAILDHHYGPGKVIERLPREVRAALTDLRAKHTQVRVDSFLRTHKQKGK